MQAHIDCDTDWYSMWQVCVSNGKSVTSIGHRTMSDDTIDIAICIALN